MLSSCRPTNTCENFLWRAYWHTSEQTLQAHIVVSMMLRVSHASSWLCKMLISYRCLWLRSRCRGDLTQVFSVLTTIQKLGLLSDLLVSTTSYPFLTQLLADLTVSVTDVSVCLDACCQTFFKSLLYSFPWFSQNLAHVTYVPVCKKTMEQVFKILIFKFLAIFLNFTLGLSLATAAAK